LRFYAGALLESQDGQPIGTLCVLDYKPRTLRQEQQDTLKILARTVMTHLDLRLAVSAQNALLAEKEILLQEINHRVKNSLQMASGMLQVQSRRTKDAAASEDFRAASSRIQAIAQVHEQLYRSDVTGQLALGRYLQDLCADLQRTVSAPEQRLSITVEGDNPLLPLDRVTTIGLIVSELVTNAVKYAYAPNAPAAVIAVSLQATASTILLRVSDSGAGLPPGFDPAQSKGLGMRLVAALAEQLHGDLTVEPQQTGCCLAIRFPGP
jgi:two-component sensor histidine kinase